MQDGVKTLAAAFAVVGLAFVGLACEKKDEPRPEEQPPVASSPQTPSGAPSDPKVAKLMEDVIAYRMRVEQDPKDVEAMAALGNANFSLGRFDHAKMWYERALKVDPERVATRIDLASSLRYLKQPDDAMSELKKVLAKDPKNPTALYNLGIILLEDKNDQKGAIACWEALITAHPDHPQAPQLRRMVEAIKQQSPGSPPVPPGG